MLERGSKRPPGARKEHGNAVEAAREAPPGARGEILRREERHRTLAEQVVVGADRHLRAPGRIAQDEIQVVRREGSQQALGRAFDTGDLGRLRQGQGGLEHAVGDQLRQDHGEADREPPPGQLGTAPHRGLELLAEIEDLVGVAEHAATEAGEHEVASGAAKERLPELLLELPHLCADRGRAQAQLPGRLHDTSLPGHGPEVEQVVIVEVLRVHRSPRVTD